MGWNEIDDKLKKKLDREFISCDEDYELQTVKDTIREEIKTLSDLQIDKAIDCCCKEIPGPRPRGKFLQCLVSVKITAS